MPSVMEDDECSPGVGVGEQRAVGAQVQLLLGESR